MDYKKIITHYKDSSIRNYFHDFLCRTYNELKTNHFSPEEFINGCILVVNDLESDFNRELEIKASEFKASYEQAKKGIGMYKSKPIPFPDEEEVVDILPFLKAQSESPEKYVYASIFDYETSQSINFKITDIIEIKKAIEECYKTIVDKNSLLINQTETLEPANLPKFTIRQHALKLYYEGFKITPKLSPEIMKTLNFAPNRKLYDHYHYFESTSNRTGNPESDVKLKNQINNFEIVIQFMLTGTAKNKATLDLEKLRRHVKD